MYYFYPLHLGLLLWFDPVPSSERSFSISFCLIFYVYFCVLRKSLTSLFDKSLVKKSIEACSPVSHSSGPGTSRSVSYVCCVCSAIKSRELYSLSPVICSGTLCLFFAVFGLQQSGVHFNMSVVVTSAPKPTSCTMCGSGDMVSAGSV